MTPCRLDEGVLLESDGILLPWGTPLAGLERLAGCVVTRYPNGAGICYEWDDRACLGGLRCRVHARRFLDKVNPHAYRLYLDHLHLASIRLLEPRLDQATAPEDFRRLLAHLEGQFGPVTWSYPRYWRGLPSVHWEFPRLLVGFRILSGADYHVSVSQEPEHAYKELRDEAAVIRAKQGKGARVEGIAW
jgi:hypothetical protein